MASSSQEILEALKQVKYPGFSRDIVSFGVVRDIKVEDERVRVTLAPPAGDAELVTKISPQIAEIVDAMAGPGKLEIVTEVPAQAGSVQGHSHDNGHSHGHSHSHAESSPQPSPVAAGPKGPSSIPGVRRVLAVASGKGGVGKSTVATNLALALKKYGRVGLLDADVYGPSAPLLLGVEGVPSEITPERRITPVEAHGISLISMGFFVEQDRPIIWRGPMLTKIVVEFIQNVDWGELDFLVLDLPPGTGDVQLTLAQRLAMDGGVIVTTPQEVALADVRRGVRMFNQVNTPVIGLIENMSGHVCGSCGHETDIFGSGGGEAMAEELGIPFLGKIGLAKAVGERGDVGNPIVESQPDSPAAQQFRQIASELSRMES